MLFNALFLEGKIRNLLKKIPEAMILALCKMHNGVNGLRIDCEVPQFRVVCGSKLHPISVRENLVPGA